MSELHIHPVKGCAGVPVGEAHLDAFGLAGDRRWLIVDPAGEFITQRDDARLGHIVATLEPDALVLRSPRAGSVLVTADETTRGTRRNVRIWRDRVDALDCGDAAAAFLHAHLGYTARLVHMPDDTLRQVDPSYAAEGDRVSFADGFPLLILSQASLDELNRRLDEPIPMLRFRPNIVIEGTRPNEEDTWRRITIGTVACDVVKPCARCVVTTIDPATATAGREPLRTLARYRRLDNRVYFGQNAIHRGAGVIRVGDEVRVLEHGPAVPSIPLASHA